MSSVGHASRPHGALPVVRSIGAHRAPPSRAPLVLQGRHVDPDHYRTLLRKAGGDELKLTPWQLGEVREAIDQLGEELFAVRVRRRPPFR